MKNIKDINSLKKETKYISDKEEIYKILYKFDWDHILRAMIDKLDNIDDLTQSQNLEMFKLISSLEDAQTHYGRLFHVQKNQTTRI